MDPTTLPEQPLFVDSGQPHIAIGLDKAPGAVPDLLQAVGLPVGSRLGKQLPLPACAQGLCYGRRGAYTMRRLVHLQVPVGWTHASEGGQVTQSCGVSDARPG